MDDEDSQSRAFTEYDDDGDKIINPGTLTEEEKRHFDLARQAHRNNMTKVQKIGSKVFKGSAFIGKPDKIVFKDFDVGKSHSLVLTLTNVSNAFNSFNVLPLPQKIRVLITLSRTILKFSTPPKERFLLEFLMKSSSSSCPRSMKISTHIFPFWPKQAKSIFPSFVLPKRRSSNVMTPPSTSEK